MIFSLSFCDENNNEHEVRAQCVDEDRLRALILEACEYYKQYVAFVQEGETVVERGKRKVIGRSTLFEGEICMQFCAGPYVGSPLKVLEDEDLMSEAIAHAKTRDIDCTTEFFFYTSALYG